MDVVCLTSTYVSFACLNFELSFSPSKSNKSNKEVSTKLTYTFTKKNPIFYAYFQKKVKKKEHEEGRVKQEKMRHSEWMKKVRAG